MRFVLRPISRPSASSSAPPDEPGASGAVCSMLPEMRRPPGPRNERAIDETKPTVTLAPPPNVAAAPKTGVPTDADSGVAPLQRRGARCVDGDDGEIAVRIDPSDLAPRRSPIGERDRDLTAAQVVGVGQDLAIGDDDAGSASVAPHAHDRRSDALRDGRDGSAQFIKGAHVRLVLLGRVGGCGN